jgi:hypothetical protein
LRKYFKLVKQWVVRRLGNFLSFKILKKMVNNKIFLTQKVYCATHSTHFNKTIPVYTLTGNTKGGRITVPLTSCLTGLDESVFQIKTKNFSCHTVDSKPVKQEVNGIVILPPLVFPALDLYKLTCSNNSETVLDK